MKILYGSLLIALVALLTASCAVVLQVTEPAYHPVTNVDFVSETPTVYSGGIATFSLTGCNKEDSKQTVILYILWSGPKGESVLGPSAAANVEPGCRTTKFSLVVPPLGTGEWYLILVGFATNGEEGQTFTTTSNSFEVVHEP